MTVARRAVGGSALIIAPLVIAALIASTQGPADQRIFVNFLIFAVLATSIHVFSGNSGVVSFGHVGFMGIGAYTAALITIPPAIKENLFSLPGFVTSAQFEFVPALLIGGAVAGVVAAALGLLMMRMREVPLTMATFALLVILYVVFNSWQAVTRGAGGLVSIPDQTTMAGALIALAIVVFAARVFKESQLGLKVRASREDPVAAASLGTNVYRVRLGAWVLSAFLMGIGGALWAQFNLAFASGQFYLEQTFALLAMVAVGGTRTVSGAVIGAAVITAITEFSIRIQEGLGPIELGQVAGLTSIIIAFLILVILRLRPEGLTADREPDQVEWIRNLSRQLGRGARQTFTKRIQQPREGKP